MQKTHASKSQITLLGGAVVGDGAAVVEVDVLSVVAGSFQGGRYCPAKGDGAYKVEFFNDEGCGCHLKISDAHISKID